MAKREPVTITFGDRDFKLRPLSLDQVERLEETVSGCSLFGGKEPAGQEAMRPIQTARAIIQIGLSRDHPDVDVAELDGDLRSFIEAQIAILRLGGFLPEGKSPGEESAAAADAPAGGTSEAA